MEGKCGTSDDDSCVFKKCFSSDDDSCVFKKCGTSHDSCVFKKFTSPSLQCCQLVFHHTILFVCRGVYKTDTGQVVNSTQKPLMTLEFLIRLCHQGGRVVDLCCGSGFGMLAALRKGHNVTGVDNSEEQLSACKARILEFERREVSDFKF